jgi:uncharacterized protein (TIGR02246 family)
MSKAASLVAQAKQWATYYGQYTTGEEAAAYTVPLRIRAAWDNNDADALADVFIDNGSLLAGDQQLTSREEIRSYFAEAFAGPFKGSRLIEDPLEVRFVADGVAVAITQGGIVLDGENELAPERTIRTMWVIVKRDGDWWLASHQTSPVKG